MSSRASRDRRAGCNTNRWWCPSFILGIGNLGTGDSGSASKPVVYECHTSIPGDHVYTAVLGATLDRVDRKV